MVSEKAEEGRLSPTSSKDSMDIALSKIRGYTSNTLLGWYLDPKPREADSESVSSYTSEDKALEEIEKDEAIRPLLAIGKRKGFNQSFQPGPVPPSGD